MKMFTFVPFIGSLPLQFGMTPDEVTALIGPPIRTFSDPFGNRSESRSGYSLGYDANSGLLTEAVFSKGDLYFQGVNLLSIADLIDYLRKFDDSPQSAVGVIFFLKLGLSLTGFYVGEEDQKSISLTRADHWDEFLEDFVPFE
ncbi:MAG: hypothetical protein R3B84_19295 [Zavarzinella sp.]